MKILLDRLSESPSHYRFDAEPSWWRQAQATLPELEHANPKAFQFEVTAHRMGSDVYLEGTICGELALGCSRCLARYSHSLREPFRLILEPAGERVPADPQAAAALAQDGLCLVDELEAGWFHGREIDLGPFFLEWITLAVPVQPLCREECRGLCPRCGADRNVETCVCEEVSPSSPFAVLHALRGTKTEGDD
jgi:uncharacterized protein